MVQTKVGKRPGGLRIVAKAASSQILSDTQGSPSETLNSSLLATIKREWIHQLRASKVVKGKAIYKSIVEDIDINEIRIIEERVRRELYG